MLPGVTRLGERRCTYVDGMSTSATPDSGPFGSPPLGSFQMDFPYGGYKRLSIDRLGNITLVVGPQGSGKSQLLRAVHEDAGCLSTSSSPAVPSLLYDFDDFPVEHILRERDALRWSGQHAPHEWVESIAREVQLTHPYWTGDLSNLSVSERAIFSMALCISMAPSGTVLLLDNLDVIISEHWPQMWRFVLGRIAASDRIQVIATARDDDVGRALETANSRSEQPAAVTLVTLGGHEHMQDHIVTGEYHHAKRR